MLIYKFFKMYSGRNSLHATVHLPQHHIQHFPCEMHINLKTKIFCFFYIFDIYVTYFKV